MERGISLLFLGFGLLILSVGFSMAYDVYPGHDQNFEGKYAIKNVTNVSMQCMTLNGVLSCDVNTLGNQSWNQALADTLYAKIIWNYNQTAPAIAYTNAVNASLASWINTNFLLKTDQRYNETSLILGINSTIWSELNLKLYATDQRYNETNLILGVNSSLWSYINANKDVWLSTYNSTYDATTRDVNANRSSWFSTYNATYATWAYNQTTATFNLYNSTWDNREIINSVNSSIWNYLSTFQGGNQSFNQTLTDSLYIHQSAFSFLQNWTGDQCPSGNYSYGYYQNGTPKCRDAVGGGSIVNFDNYTIIFSSTWGVNQSWINNTIDQRFVFLNGTIYTSDEVYINKLGTTFTFNQTKENIDIMALLNSVGIISQDIKSVNLTAATYAGNLTSGGLTGYDAANNICNLDYPGSHMCNEFEVTSYLAKVGENNFYTQTNDDAWVIAGGPKYVPAVTPVDDCMGFTNSEPTAVGNYWKYKTVNGGGKAINCQNDLKLSCCTIAPVNSSGGSANFTTDSYFLFDGSLLQMNTATLNATIDARQTGGGNASWNQGLADTLYYSITNPLNFINKTEADNYYEPLGGVGEMSQFTNDSNTIYNKPELTNLQFKGNFEVDNASNDVQFKVSTDLFADSSNVTATMIDAPNSYFINLADQSVCGIPGWVGGGKACGNITGYNSTGDIDWQYISEQGFNFIVPITAPNICYSNGSNCQSGSGSMDYTNVAMTNQSNTFNGNISMDHNRIFGLDKLGVGTDTVSPLNQVEIEANDSTGQGIGLSVRNVDGGALSFAVYRMSVGLGNEGGIFFGSRSAYDAYGIVNGLTFRAGTPTQDLGFSTGNAVNGTATSPTMIIKANQDIFMNGNLNVSKNVTASKFIGDGNLLTGINYPNIFNQVLNTTSNVTFAGLTATGLSLTGSSSSFNDTSKNSLPNAQSVEPWANMTGNNILLHMDTDWNDYSVNNYASTVTSATITPYSKIGNGAGKFIPNSNVVYSSFSWTNRTSDPVTVNFWIYQTTAQVGNVYPFGWSADSGSDRFAANFYSDKFIYWDYGNAGGNGRVSTNFTNYLNKWTMVTLTSKGKNGNYMGIYLDGNLVASAAASDGPHKNLASFQLGYDQSANYFNGTLDEFAIWNRSLSAGEVSNIYNAQVGGYTLSGTMANITLPSSGAQFYSNGVNVMNILNGTSGTTLWTQYGISATRFTTRTPKDTAYVQDYYSKIPTPSSVLDLNGKINLDNPLFSSAKVVTSLGTETDLTQLVFKSVVAESEMKAQIETLKSQNQQLRNCIANATTIKSINACAK